MEDVADVNIGRVRENLSIWEDDRTPLAPLTSQERDTIIELTSVSGWRPLPSSVTSEETRSGGGREDGGGSKRDSEHQRDSSKRDSLSEHHLSDSLARLKLGEVKIESSQQVGRTLGFCCVLWEDGRGGGGGVFRGTLATIANLFCIRIFCFLSFCFYIMLCLFWCLCVCLCRFSSYEE